MKHILTIMMAFCLSLVVSCADQAMTPPEPTLLIEPETVSFLALATSKSVKVTTNQDTWTAKFAEAQPEGWSISTTKDELTITVTKNTDLNTKSAKINISAGSLEKEVRVSQLGESPAILVDKSSVSLTEPTEATFTIVVTTNVDIDVNISGAWITQTSPAQSKVMTDRSYTFNVAANDGAARTANITFTKQGATSPTSSVSVSQASYVDPSILYSAKNLTITAGAGGEIPAAQFEKIKAMEQGTIIVQHLSSASGLQSLFGIGDGRVAASHFHLYVNGSTIGFETRGAGDINGGGTTTLPATKLQTVALKAEKGVGYKIFANGKLILDKPFVGDAYKFISNLPNLNGAFVGKTPRAAGSNVYPYSGNIKSIEIHNKLISDEQLLEITNETPAPAEYIPVAKFDMFYNGDPTGCGTFRIPALVTLKSGVVLASIDARFGGATDSPNNLDNTLRRSTDGGKTFTAPTFPLNFLDYPNAGGYKTWSASFIDPVMMHDRINGRVYMMIDAFPWGGGLVTGGRCHPGAVFKTINGNKYLALTNVEVPSDKALADKDPNEFNFTIRENGVIWDDVKGIATEYSVNGKFEVMKNGVLLTVKQQENNSVDVPMSVYFERSLFRVLRTSHLWIIHSDDDGQTWSDPTNVTYLKKDTEQFLIAGPGNSIQIQKGAHAGRLLFPVYFKIGGTERCAVIYSDDQGKTWKRGDTPTLSAGVNKMSEAQLVELPDGSVALFARNSGKGMISYAISKDGCATFGIAAPTPLQNAGGNGCQISIVNLSKQIDGFPAVAISFSNNADSRNEGTIAIGLIKESGTTYTFDWKYKKLVSPGSYGYSCLSELPNGNLGLLFEGANLQKIQFMEIDIETLKR